MKGAKVPDPPMEMFPYVNWDLSPVRPWEWGQIDAEEWLMAQEIQTAYHAGEADAQDEHRTAKGER